ncbi:hypothetical protein PPTG_15564 [Phytophthora nicotianae INRA-310]|uniref:glucan endo-1,3-beta-D-glucosidase n=2 Tax=Phytophthora nicotianae TaxID=4792 RepID=W2PTK9_PHYN3|nr:hypothetical protein PPTG_15564 [Phytophthora nicotianae INRA-310]ETN03579.1 hypothetical protein PPTG_15564 [Phytophthora nicotianae INRA-310]KUF79306.1 glucan endo-1 [Phytophthora nicotianae]
MLPFKLLSTLVTFTSALSFIGTSAQNFCIHGINYNPRIGPDWAPVEQRCKTPASIQEDMETLAQVTRSIRLYGLEDCDQSSTVLPAAINAGLTVSLGLWVTGDDAVFESEFEQLQTLIQQHSDLFTSGRIVDIHVGSEAIYRKEITAATNIEYLQRVKALLTAYNVDVLATIAEIGDVYLAHPELINAVDFVQANGFPFWERIAVENAVAYFESRMEPLYLQAIASDKKLVIGETGWASGGLSPNASEASPSNAAHYFNDFYQMAQQQGLEFYYFEGFDEEWKVYTTDDTVEGYFGLFQGDRTLKPEIAALSLGSSCSTSRSEEASASSGAYTPGTDAPAPTESTSTTTPPPTSTARPEECHVRRS